MHKLIATLFLLLFAVAQYGKLIGYWNCTITKNSDPQAVQCDCQKILETSSGHQDLNMQAKGSLSLKTEEWIHSPVSVLLAQDEFEKSTHAFSPVTSSPFTGYTGSVFQPPRLS